MGLKLPSGIIIFCFLSAGIAAAFADEQSQVVKLSEVPAAARKTMLAESGKGNGRLGEIEKVQEDGETWYDAELIKGNVERSFSVDPEGKLLSWQVFLREVPAAAQNAIRAQVRPGKDKLGDINRVVEEGRVTFEVDLTKEGKEISFTVGEDGKMLAMQVELGDVPKLVQKAIQKQAGDAVIKKIEKNTGDDDGEIVFDVDTEKGGKKISFSVDSQGQLVED